MDKKFFPILLLLAALSACSAETETNEVKLSDKEKEEIKKEIVDELKDEPNSVADTNDVSRKNKVDLGGVYPWDYYDDVNEFMKEASTKTFFDRTDSEKVENKAVEAAKNKDTLFTGYLLTFINQTKSEDMSDYYDTLNEANNRLGEGKFDEAIELINKAKSIREGLN